MKYVALKLLNHDQHDDLGDFNIVTLKDNIKTIVDIQDSYIYEILNLETLKRQLDEINDKSDLNIDDLISEKVIKELGKTEEVRDLFVFEYDNLEISNLLDFDSCEIYEMYNGHNWCTQYIDSEEYEFRMTDLKWINIDEWEGRNFSTYSNHYHVRIAKLDGEYITYEYDNYVGTNPRSRILTETELEKFLENVDRLKYLAECINL